MDGNPPQWTPPSGYRGLPPDDLDDDRPDDVWQDDHSLRNAVIGVAVAVVVVGLLIVGLVLLRGGGDEVATDATTSSSSTTTGVTSTSTTLVPTSATFGPTSSTTPVSLAALTVVETTLNFGAATNSLDLHVRNDGGQSLQYRVTTSNQAVLVSPASGVLGAGQGEIVRVTLSRTGLSEGAVSERVTVDAGSAGASSVVVTAISATPPQVVSAESAEPAIFATCPAGGGGTTTTAITATARDNSGVEAMELRWSGPESGRRNMTLSVGAGNDVNGSATIGPFASPGDVTWEVVATDVHGNASAAFTGTLVVADCDDVP